jgi:hypothetical protein
MSHIESILAEQESRNTFAAFTILALGLMIVPPPHTQTNIVLAKEAARPTFCREVQGTVQVSEPELEIDYSGFFDQLNRIYDYLLQGRTVLDDESHRILYSNLWNLYE